MVYRLNGFDSPEGQAALNRAELLIKQVYHEQLVNKADLAIRDKVIKNVKDSFLNCPKKDYP